MTRVRHDHHHETQDIIDPETNEPITPGGPGGAASLEAVLTEGNETGDVPIVGATVGTEEGGSVAAQSGQEGSHGGNSSVAGGAGGPGVAGGRATLVGGGGDDDTSSGAEFQARGGVLDGTGGEARVIGGDAAASSDANGGDITLIPGAGDGEGEDGKVIISEAVIQLPMATIDGTTDWGELDIIGVVVAGGHGARLGVQPGSGGDGGTGVVYGGNSDAGSEGGLVQADGGLHAGAGGDVLLRGGHAVAASDGDGGDITLTPGAGDGAGRAGQIVVNGQVTLAAGTLIHGADSGADGIHADLLGGGGDGDVTGVNGAYISAGGGRASGQGGEAYFQGGNAKAGSDARGGDFYFESGVGDGAGRNGLIFLNLPTSDPHVAGALWASLGIVTVSAG